MHSARAWTSMPCMHTWLPVIEVRCDSWCHRQGFCACDTNTVHNRCLSAAVENLAEIHTFTLMFFAPASGAPASGAEKGALRHLMRGRNILH